MVNLKTIQTLKDKLRPCVLEFKDSWVKHLSLVEFVYNNKYQASIGIASYEALYERKWRTPIYWDEVGERKLNDVELIEVTIENIRIIRERLKIAQDRQKSYTDTRKKELEFEVRDMMFFKVTSWNGVIRFQKRGKLNPRYIGPFRILERIRQVAYQLELPRDLERIHDVFHVFMLRKYTFNPSHVLEAPHVKLKKDLSFKVQPMGIIDQKLKELRNKVIPKVKVLWKGNIVKEMTWETEASMRSSYLYLINA